MDNKHCRGASRDSVARDGGKAVALQRDVVVDDNRGV